jgi:hypothetical protein
VQIEVEVDCELSVRQRRLYEGIKQKITLEDLLSANNATSKAESDAASKHLMNLVMQFRKVSASHDTCKSRPLSWARRIRCGSWSIV